MNLSGGYLTHRRPAIRVGQNTHTTDLHQPISQLDLDAINAVQATPWRINRWLLDVMQEAWASGMRLGGLEVGEPLSLPKKLPDEVWEGMSPKERNDYVGRRVAIHAENDGIMGRSRAVLDALTVAEELRDKPAIWYPYSKDFRGRIYPQATFGPHPQGDDIQKALIMFAEGVPLGPDGEFWLRVRAANAAGQDKLTMEERVKWTLEHQREIVQSAADPLRFTWWAEVAKKDEPWNLLATCYELASAMSLSSPETFVSHLPIPMDGSCNGLQHLAAMGLDPVGARATNLVSSETKQDIYEEVAKAVRLQVEQDVLDGIDEARIWQGNITRKVVKRAVMTTPYGVTDRGIRDQLILDGHVPDDGEIGKGAAADYLRDKLVQALGSTVQSARSIMAWLQTTADRLARAGLPFDWTTPSGSRVRQAYHVSTREQLRTLVGSAVLYNEVKEAGLNIRKQALGSAPNVIHSFDAAHLSMTVETAAREGITAFAMIHDSYGTHAGNTTRLAAILRQKFVDIYRTDWLQRIKAEIATYAPHVKVDDPPARGAFDIEQVRDAPYFFS
jgi:DNA-directed RNA polymerase, mitochondrial